MDPLGIDLIEETWQSLAMGHFTQNASTKVILGSRLGICLHLKWDILPNGNFDPEQDD